MPPFRESSNNRILPANARAADVATKAIEEISHVQQQRYLAAFSPQGYQCILYSRIEGGGSKCSCQNHRRIVNSILGKDGKASPGVINELLTGTTFQNNRYGSVIWKENGFDSPTYPTPNNTASEADEALWEGLDSATITSPAAPGNKHQGVFDIATKGGEYPNERIVDGDGFGDNGPVRAKDLDALVKDWDTGVIRGNDPGCPVCFGTGFIGGFTPLYGWRKVVVPYEVDLMDGSINSLSLPFSAQDCTQFRTVLQFPRGAHTLDTATLWNGINKIPYLMYVEVEGSDPVRVTENNLKTLCDGKPKVFRIDLLNNNSAWTHFEVQFNLGSFQQSARFEFPKQPKSADGNMLERTQPFLIVLDPGVPQEVKVGDIITESVNGKSLIVGAVTPWNTRNRKLLGQEITVRALQPMEYFNLLPRRGRVPTKDRTTDYLMDNVTGPRRT